MVLTDEETRKKDYTWAKEFVDAHQWIFAKTYAKTTPHEYIVVRADDVRRADFRRMFELIEKYGVEEKFFGKPWIYLYLGDGYKYFSANGKGWEEDRYILNRAKAEVVYGA